MNDDANSESDSMLRHALPIGPVLSSNSTPQDGLEYLSQVHRQAKQIPDVMSVDRSKFTYTQPTPPPITNTRSFLNDISEQFINQQLKNFSQTRQYCCRMQKLYPNKVVHRARMEKCKKLFDEPPSLPIILALTQTFVFDLLEYVGDVCLSSEVESRVPGSVSSWVFALLAVVDKPVPMDYMSILR